MARQCDAAIVLLLPDLEVKVLRRMKRRTCESSGIICCRPPPCRSRSKQQAPVINCLLNLKLSPSPFTLFSLHLSISFPLATHIYRELATLALRFNCLRVFNVGSCADLLAPTCGSLLNLTGAKNQIYLLAGYPGKFTG